jgi:hypothetical protein
MENSKRDFEATIEAALLCGGGEASNAAGASGVREQARGYLPEPCEPALGGYHLRMPQDYDRVLCLIPTDVMDLLY